MADWKSVMRRNGAPFIFATALLSGSILLLLLVNYFVPHPYMDEIFHVDQMQRYCQGRFNEWNDKITTPPALYITSYGIWRVIDAITSLIRPIFDASLAFDCNSVTNLRFLNLLFLVILFFVVSDILKLNASKSARFGIGNPIVRYSTALNLCFFPILYLTAFLYYTDVLSTLAVMATYLFHLRRYRMISALLGACSCAVRQTNIMWVAFCCYLTAIQVLTDHLHSMDEKERLGRRKRQDDGVDQKYIDYESDIYSIVVKLEKLIRWSRWSEMGWMAVDCVWAILGYLLVAIGFVAFIMWNGGVALGDRSAHQACIHLVQYSYCALFCCFFGSAVVVSKASISAVFRFLRHRPVLAISLLGLMVVVIHYFTYDHPYLLADNRHYTFYIWRRWFMRHAAMKYLLAPIYVCAFVVMNRSISPSCSVLWRLGFFACVFLVTVPNRLLEFRYFILPFFFWRLHVWPVSKARVGLEFLLFFCINAVTFALFLGKPFKWPNSDEWQRFIW